MDKIDYVKQGKANRAKGAKFERDVRKYLESKGWIVCKWQNNFNSKGEIVPAKQKFIGGRGMGLGSGFPDFIAYTRSTSMNQSPLYRLMYVECKTNGILKKEEKQKMEILREMGHNCWVAYNEEGKITFRKFVEYKERRRVRRKKTGD